jgi:hypothetical protein
MSDQNEHQPVEATHYPAFLHSAKKGDWISPQQFIADVGIEYPIESPSYRFALLHWKQQLEDHLNITKGIKAVVVERNNGLAVLIDSEAAEYTNTAMSRSFRRAKRMHRKMVQKVDPNGLSAEERLRWDRNAAVQGAKLQAAERAGRKALKHIQQGNGDLLAIGSDQGS